MGRWCTKVHSMLQGHVHVGKGLNVCEEVGFVGLDNRHKDWACTAIAVLLQRDEVRKFFAAPGLTWLAGLYLLACAAQQSNGCGAPLLC